MQRGLFWVVFGGAAAVTVLVCWTAWVFLIQPMDAAMKTANRLERIFSGEFEITPRISANAGVLFSQTTRVENLVGASRKISIELTLDMPLEDGTQPAVHAEFLVEAGFAGRESLDIDLRRGGREADAKIPKAKILDLQLLGAPAVDSAKTSWDDLPERTQSRILRQLRLAARKRVLDDGLPAEADGTLRARLQALAAQAGCVLFFETPKTP